MELNPKLMKEYYANKKALHKLEKKIELQSNFIKQEMTSRGLSETTIGGYWIKIKKVDKIKHEFINLIRVGGYADLIKESVSREDFKTVCERLNLNEADYLQDHFEKLYVIEKHCNKKER